MGVHNPDTLDTILETGFSYVKTLLLGYKQWGFGRTFHSEVIDHNISLWKRDIPFFLNKEGSNLIFAFDNLAIDQLELSRLFFDPLSWNTFYMGDDFSYTMYIDAVNQEFAPTSRSGYRRSWDQVSLLQFFGIRDLINMQERLLINENR